jgi:hypothetical protein
VIFIVFPPLGNYFIFECVHDFADQILLKHRAEVLSSVPKHKNAVMCLMKKESMPNQLRSGMC